MAPEHQTTAYQISAAMLPERFPALWRACYPRIYKDTDRYGSPKVVAAGLAMSTIAVATHGHACSATVKNIHIANTKLIKQRIPTFFVGQELLEAAAATTPPPELRWMDLELPFEAAILMLPKGWLRDPVDGPCDFVGYNRNLIGEEIHLPAGLLPSPFRLIAGHTEGPVIANSFCVFSGCHESPSFPMMDFTINDDDAPFLDDAARLDEIYPPRPTGPWIPGIPTGAYDALTTPEEKLFTHQLLQLVFRLLLVAEARPTLISYGKRKGIHKHQRPLEIWTPNFLGLHYRYQREGGTGTGEDGQPRRLHWRRGHARAQAIGSRLEEPLPQTPEDIARKRSPFYHHRRRWIEPVLLGGTLAEREAEIEKMQKRDWEFNKAVNEANRKGAK